MSAFIALLCRIKGIRRWALMRQTREETLSEHTLETAYLAHLLITLGNRRLGRGLDPGRGVLLALYHDAGEILTGDLPTPIKYYRPEMTEAYRSIEREAGRRLLALLPQDLQPDYRPFLQPQPEDAAYGPYIKAADKLSALLKCQSEVAGGNREFSHALQATLDSPALALEEAQIFLREFYPPCGQTLDEIAPGARL